MFVSEKNGDSTEALNVPRDVAKVLQNLQDSHLRDQINSWLPKDSSEQNCTACCAIISLQTLTGKTVAELRD